MSKLDAQRAMREAKYARDRASGPTRREAAAADGGAPVAPASPEAKSPKAQPAKAKSTSKKPAAGSGSETGSASASGSGSASGAGETCGHRSMNGRACTREAGHSEKSHRYS